MEGQNLFVPLQRLHTSNIRSSQQQGMMNSITESRATLPGPAPTFQTSTGTATTPTANENCHQRCRALSSDILRRSLWFFYQCLFQQPNRFGLCLEDRHLHALLGRNLSRTNPYRTWEQNPRALERRWLSGFCWFRMVLS